MDKENKLIHVAVAVIFSPDKTQVLLSKRPNEVHQGGLWEFPGGKLDQGESAQEALSRELDEELGIHPSQSRPLIRLRHHYPDLSVLLDVWRVEAYTGIAHGRENQTLEWVHTQDLAARAFPEANQPIIQALSLPDRYLITPNFSGDQEAFLASLEGSLKGGIRLLQLRVKDLSNQSLIRKVIARVHDYQGKVLINGDAQQARELGADGVHLNSERLNACAERPAEDSFLVAASCHNPEQLRKAGQIGCNFAMLSPVAATASHPDTTPLGWPLFQQWVDDAAFPVYALGGMGISDLDDAFSHGGQGIAAISGLWGPIL